MSKLSDKFNSVIGKEDKSVSFTIRTKESERKNWNIIAKKNGFSSTAGLIKFMMNKVDKNPEKILG